MTPASQHLLSIAKKLSQAYLDLPKVYASMVTGSVSEGLSDQFSDIDMAMYYSELPSDIDLERIRIQVSGATKRNWLIGSRKDQTLIESFMVAGVECQVIHATLEAVDQQLNTVLLEHEVSTPTHKVLSGLLKSIPLHGEAILQTWKDHISDFPDELSEKMVRHHLQFFPMWGIPHQFTARDARLFYTQSLLENVQNVLGVLAGLNKVYYSTFQFKRSEKFIAKFLISPPNLYQRLEQLLYPS